MSRAFRESNAGQAVREVVTNGFAVPIASALSVYAHKTTTNKNAQSPFFLIPLAIMIQVFSREVIWNLRYVFWVIRCNSTKKRKHRARAAKPKDYVWYAAIYTMVFLFAAVPEAINLVAESVGQYKFKSLHAAIDPIAYGGVVAFVTSDLLGSGLIAALERWGTLNDQDFSRVSNVILLVAAILATSLAVLHAFRTLLALVGKDVSYRRFMIAERFGWDADSEALAAEGLEDPITASTNHARPFSMNRHCPSCNCFLDTMV